MESINPLPVENPLFHLPGLPKQSFQTVKGPLMATFAKLDSLSISSRMFPDSSQRTSRRPCLKASNPWESLITSLSSGLHTLVD
ncbi:unnamed protein product [Sphenostylis stenocarpa]|uniref:Uncharacterized protein n=1 Tax=Sphenostylis stenocarpa TaxID=92480 RepID=A0AA86VZ03_9FABA|nr:unnamed protein product [Sphenostylis stenocarpa]